MQEDVRLTRDAAEAHNTRGIELAQHGKLEEAAASFQQALRLDPNFPEAHNNLGSALKLQGKLEEAVARFQEALRLWPNFADAHNNLGSALADQGKLAEAERCFRRAVLLNPNFRMALLNLGNILKNQGKRDQAAASFLQAVRLRPDGDDPEALGALLFQCQHMCHWETLGELSNRVIEAVERGWACGPFRFMVLPTATTAEQQHRCARQWVDQTLKRVMHSGRGANLARPHRAGSKITVGYLSANFRTHPNAYLTAELFEKHDRQRFEVLGYSLGADDGGSMRRRLVKAFDRFVDLTDASFVESAERIAADGVDILVDLMGFTRASRTQILALRPAPVQVIYLGYPGTMGAPFMDYILVDDFIVRPEQQPYFTEQLVYLPGCYQVNDSRREIAPQTPARAECGLPEEGFVFCCLNNNFKITPAVFDVWMRLLGAVPGSVLWLAESNRFAPANLRKEAQVRGIDARRLVFARHLPLPEHLARHRLGDLFLDTFPVNAHTAASDALWAGCPVLTMAGETFVSRVAASLLRSLDLPELITSSLDAYQEMALRLAQDQNLLASLRARLASNREKSALFDGGQFARNLEKAYATMWEIYTAGEKPRPFAVSPA